MKTDLEFIKYIVHLDVDEYNDGCIVDMIDEYCNLRETLSIGESQDIISKTYDLIF